MRVLLISLLIGFLSSPPAQAQSEIEEVEKIFRDEGSYRTDEMEAPNTVVPRETAPPGVALNEIRNLEPYYNFVAIQRRYLPKSSRFELHASVGAMVNDPFFNNFASEGRLGYSFTESWAIEAIGISSSAMQKDVTDQLQNRRGVTTENLLTPQYFYGGAIKWSPIYGKQSFFNRRIAHFDHYFTVGAGITGTNQRTEPFTYAVGTGQVYALTHSLGIRWDLLWLIYNTESSRGGPTQFGKYNNVFLTVGISYFFPEVGYR